MYSMLMIEATLTVTPSISLKSERNCGPVVMCQFPGKYIFETHIALPENIVVS